LVKICIIKKVKKYSFSDTEMSTDQDWIGLDQD